MKKLILSVMLVAFAVAVQAGDDQGCSKEKAACCKAKAEAKAGCSVKAGCADAKEAKGCPFKGEAKDAKKLTSPKGMETAKN